MKRSIRLLVVALSVAATLQHRAQKQGNSSALWDGRVDFGGSLRTTSVTFS